MIECRENWYIKQIPKQEQTFGLDQQVIKQIREDVTYIMFIEELTRGNSVELVNLQKKLEE